MKKTSRYAQKNKKQNKTKNTDSAAQDGTASPTVIDPRGISVQCSIACPNGPDKEHQAKERDYWKDQIRTAGRQNVIALVTAAIAFAALGSAIAAAIYSYGQRNAAQDQLKEMRAAKRAWVGFSDSQGIKDSSAIYLTFTNGGQSPALNVFISVDSDVHAITASSSSCTDDCVLNGAEMLPNVPFKFRVPRTDQPDPGPNLPFWIVARIDYKDVDGGSHKTLICFERRENRPSTELVACPEKDSNYAD